MITVVVGKEIEKIKGDFESYLNGLNMVGEISYSQYSKLYDEGVKQIQRAYELGKSELEEENAELKTKKIPQLERKIASIRGSHSVDAKKLNARIEQVERLKKENAELKEVHESDKRSLRLIAEKGAKLELKIKKLTQHLEPQSMTALFEQVEEEVNQEQKIKELEAYNEKLLNGDIEKHNKIVELQKELEKERKINEEIKVRFVKCSSCTEDLKQEKMQSNS